MKFAGVALATLGLLIQAGGAYAISFAPPKSIAVPAGEAAAASNKWTIGLAASSWGIPDISENGATIKMDSQVRPLATLEYQVNDKISVGGWYNAIAWNATYSDATTAATPIADVDGNIWEAHATYALPQNYAAQFGYQRSKVDLDFSRIGAGKESLTSDALVLWGLKTIKVGAPDKSKLGVLLGLGVAQGLGSGSTTEGNALVGASYAFRPNISADASLWLPDFTSSDSVTRFTAGVTGRF